MSMKTRYGGRRYSDGPHPLDEPMSPIHSTGAASTTVPAEAVSNEELTSFLAVDEGEATAEDVAREQREASIVLGTAVGLVTPETTQGPRSPVVTEGPSRDTEDGSTSGDQGEDVSRPSTGLSRADSATIDLVDDDGVEASRSVEPIACELRAHETGNTTVVQAPVAPKLSAIDRTSIHNFLNDWVEYARAVASAGIPKERRLKIKQLIEPETLRYILNYRMKREYHQVSERDFYEFLKRERDAPAGHNHDQVEAIFSKIKMDLHITDVTQRCMKYVLALERAVVANGLKSSFSTSDGQGPKRLMNFAIAGCRPEAVRSLIKEESYKWARHQRNLIYFHGELLPIAKSQDQLHRGTTKAWYQETDDQKRKKAVRVARVYRLSTEQAEKAKQEQLCFECMKPGHMKRQCPKLRGPGQGGKKRKDDRNIPKDRGYGEHLHAKRARADESKASSSTAYSRG